MLGYESVLMVDVVVNAGRTTTIDFTLRDEAFEADEVVITAQRPDVERDKTATSHIVRFDDVQALPGVRDISDVLGLTGDVVDGHFRGGRQGEELYMLQGMGIVNPLDNSAAFMPIMSAVEEVEVITSGFGAQYGNAQSGVVRISMREGDRHNWDTRFEVRTRAPASAISDRAYSIPMRTTTCVCSCSKATSGSEAIPRPTILSRSTARWHPA
jgi:outer membrane receptor for ferrienterochelin and colicin